MRRLITFLILVFLAILLGTAAHADSGYLLLSIYHWTIETTVWMGFFIVLAAFLVLTVLFKLIKTAFLLPSNIGQWKSKQAKQYAHRKLVTGLYQLVDGQWDKAETTLQKSAKHSKTPSIHYLAASIAACHTNLEARDNYLQKASHTQPHSPLTIGLIQAQLQINASQWEQALDTLTQLRTKHIKNKRVLILLKETYLALNEWHALIQLLPAIQKQRTMKKEHVNQLEIYCYQQLIHECQRISLDKTKSFWLTIPNRLQKQGELIATYAIGLLSYEKHNDVEQLLSPILKKQWDMELIEIYGQIHSDNISKQLSIAENWLKSYNKNPVLLLCLGKLCVTHELWGKAKDYLQQTIQLSPSVDAFFALALVYKESGDKDNALATFQKAVGYCNDI